MNTHTHTHTDTGMQTDTQPGYMHKCTALVSDNVVFTADHITSF